MSAFVVSQNHVSALAHYAVVKKVWLDGRSATQDDFKSIYKVLAAENVRSVCCRYEDDKPENYAAFVSGRGVKPHVVLDAVQVVKLADCLEYQSCETENYRETEAYKLLNRIRSAATYSLPGYDDAKWAIA